MKRILLSAAAAAVLCLAASVASAQSFPNRPIRIIVSFPPGGATDVIARTIGAPLGQRLGQNVVVDNRPGSNGNISAELAANARPDGHTLLLGSDSLFGINPHLYSRMPVDLRKAFVPVANLVTNMVILDGQSGKGSVEDVRRIHRVRAQGQSAAVLCVDRQRQPASHRDGIAQAHRQDRSHARALQGRRTGRHRDGRRRDAWRCSAAARWCRWCAQASCARSRSAAPSVRRRCRSCRPSPRPIPGIRSRSGRDCLRRPARRRRS